MTKEPIMIDDVDVSGCPFYEYQTEQDLQMRYPNSGDCEIGLAGYLFDFSPIQEQLEKHCIDNPNCHFKQLKRKEQEYNRLSNLITSTKNYEITCLNCKDAILTFPTISGRTKFSQIEVEESSLKKIIEQFDQLKAELLAQEAETLKAGEIINNYKQALQEIKEIITKSCINVDENDYIHLSHVKQILQKCEVFDAN